MIYGHQKHLEGVRERIFSLSCYEHQNLENLIELFEFPVYALSINGESLYESKIT